MKATRKKPSFGKTLFGDRVEERKPGRIAEQFLWLPSTCINARDGAWKKRKRAWLSLGIKSEMGRSGGSSGHSKKKPKLPPGGGGGGCWLGGKKTSTSELYKHTGDEGSGTSIFDPVLCELVYRWFCPRGGQVVDPFAGGSVRGIVAQQLGLDYWGCELRNIQVESNIEQAQRICDDLHYPQWICGDSREKLCEAPEADMIFSCPPYGNLEVYSDDPADLSNMCASDFLYSYADIIWRASQTLKHNRFIAWVVGDYRDKQTGNYVNFISRTIELFKGAKCHLWNHVIYITPVGSIPIRIGKQFKNSRKLAKTHQDLLIFVKGDGMRAAKACGEIYTGW